MANHDETDEREFDVLMTANGVTVPADRKRGALAVHWELRRMARLLRRERDAMSEPSNTFDLRALVRGG